MANLLGQYLTFLCAIDLLSCAVFYTLIMLNRFQRPANVKKIAAVKVQEGLGDKNAGSTLMTAVISGDFKAYLAPIP